MQVLTTLSFGQKTKEQAFVSTVNEIVLAFSKQDTIAIAKFVDKKTGLYQLFRTGVYDQYNHFTDLNFSDPYTEAMLKNAKGIQFSSLMYAKLPTWDCDKSAWSKKGLFVDIKKTDHLLSKICKDRNKYLPDSIAPKTIQYFYDLENKSRRVVLVDNQNVELVFYLTYLNEKWFLTIVDNVSSNCSA